MPQYVKRASTRTSATTDEVKATVAEIINAVRKEGITAVRHYSKQLDDWSPDTFRVTQEEIAAANQSLDENLIGHIHFARDQVERFARAQLESIQPLEVETLPGVILGHTLVPVEAVGSYSPGGRYPLIASSIMTIVVPKVAGVGRVVAAAPPRGGRGIHPPQLYAMSISGADEIYCMGGVQALAAMAFGIDGLAAVDMLVGAGNVYVAEAKRQLFGEVGIDLLAGPTEILIIADETANPDLVAVDLLGQAEHGPTSPAILVTDSPFLADAVVEAVESWLHGSWPTADVAGAAWRAYGEIVICTDSVEVVEVANAYAPEHLEVQTADPDWYFHRLRNYGSLFIGAHSTVAYGDKAVGTNHVLPTARAARYTGGLWVGKFLKTLTYQRLSAEGTRQVAPSVAAISDAELMFGHALTARYRLQAASEML